MKILWSQMLAVLCLVAVSSGVYTEAFFFDREATEDNTLNATNLIGDLAGVPISANICGNGAELSGNLVFGNTGALDLLYNFRTESLVGGFCEYITAEVLLDGSSVYTGPLVALNLAGLPLAPGESDTVSLTLQVPAGSGSCTFDTVFEAYQEGFSPSVAFFDSERLTHMVVADASSCTPTGPTVLLYLNKHISGETLGFELSDFSYHVTGEGVDAIVPHDSTVALPIGIYTIEEIVPEGFVKEDWRIGWYGQCERGGTFVTTITIDEGNIDHGTLYCEADNQYRPGHGDNEAANTVSDSTLDSASAEPEANTETNANSSTTESSSTVVTEVTSTESSSETETEIDVEEVLEEFPSEIGDLVGAVLQ